MEALHLSLVHSPALLRPKRHRSVPNGPHQLITARRAPIKPFIAATLSRPTAEISATSTSCENVSRQYHPFFLLPDRTATGKSDNGAIEYRKSILSFKNFLSVAIETPLGLATKLSERLGVNVWLKREDFLSVFSLKFRIAYNMMAELPREQLDRGVICLSAGNHAHAVALAAKKLGCNAVVAMPVTTPQFKWQPVETLGATVVLVGDSYDEAQAYAKKRAEEEGQTFIPVFDHPDVIMEQGTVGMEIMRQTKGPLHAIFVPVVGGGLIAGIAAYVKRVSPKVKIIGVEPSDTNAMTLSLHHGERIVLDQVGGFADGVAVKEVGEETFSLCKELMDGVVFVSHDAICGSIKDMFEETRRILEPAGALALAGAEAYCKYYGLKGENVVAITSGAKNFDQLRVATELAYVGWQQQPVLAAVIPEEPGSLKHYCELVGPMNISEFKYRYNSDKEAIVLYSVGVHTASELQAMQERMEFSKLKTYNLTGSDLDKDHLLYSMGGRSNVQNEVLCRFMFPAKRSGALMKFLDVFSPRWNISLFHYRAQGLTEANVLVGIQVSRSEIDEFHARANSLGYDYVVVTNDDD